MLSGAGLGIVSPGVCTRHEAHLERYAVFFLKMRETWIDRLFAGQKQEARFGPRRGALCGARGREGGPCPGGQPRGQAAWEGLSQGLSFLETCKPVEGLSAEAVTLTLSAAGRGLGGRRQERLPGRPALGHAGGAAPPGHAGDGQHAPPGRRPAPVLGAVGGPALGGGQAPCGEGHQEPSVRLGGPAVAPFPPQGRLVSGAQSEAGAAGGTWRAAPRGSETRATQSSGLSGSAPSHSLCVPTSPSGRGELEPALWGRAW